MSSTCAKDPMPGERMSKADRDALVRVVRERAKQAEREVDARAKATAGEGLR